MDAATIQLHRQLLRLLKGALKSYEAWVDEEAAVVTVKSLKQRKQDLTKATTEETGQV